MAVIGSIRKRSGLLIGVIVVALVLFLVSDMFRNPMGPQDQVEAEKDMISFGDVDTLLRADVDSLYGNAIKYLYYGREPIGSSFIGNEEIKDVQAARDFSLAMRLLLQEDIDALGGVTLYSNADYQSMISQDAAASMFFRNSIFDTIDIRSNVEMADDTLVQFLNSGAQVIPGQSNFNLAKVMADEMKNVRTINYNLAVLNSGLRSPVWMNETFDKLRKNAEKSGYSKTTIKKSSDNISNSYQGYRFFPEAEISCIVMAQEISNENFEKAQNNAYSEAKKKDPSAYEVVDLTQQTAILNNQFDFTDSLVKFRQTGNKIIPTVPVNGYSSMAIVVQETFGLSYWKESPAITLDSMRKVVNSDLTEEEIFDFALSNDLIIEDSSLGRGGFDFNAWAKTYQSPRSFSSTELDSAGMLVVKWSQDTVVDYSVVSWAVRKVSQPSSKSNEDFTKEADKQFKVLSDAWNPNQAIPVGRVTAGYSGISSIEALENNKDVIDWVFSNEEGAVKWFESTDNATGFKSRYFIHIDRIFPEGEVQNKDELPEGLSLRRYYNTPGANLPNILAYDAVSTPPIWGPMTENVLDFSNNRTHTELMLDLFFALRNKDWSF